MRDSSAGCCVLLRRIHVATVRHVHVISVRGRVRFGKDMRMHGSAQIQVWGAASSSPQRASGRQHAKGGGRHEQDLEGHVAGPEEPAEARDRVPGAAGAAPVEGEVGPMQCPKCRRGVLLAMTGPFGDFLRCSRRGCGFTELTGVGARRPWS